jgi:hypothetical protein
VLRPPLTSADRADCCPADPVVQAVLPATAAREHAVELLLCHHHWRRHRPALQAAGALFYGRAGELDRFPR